MFSLFVLFGRLPSTMDAVLATIVDDWWAICKITQVAVENN
jgi:hypothetical protein